MGPDDEFGSFKGADCENAAGEISWSAGLVRSLRVDVGPEQISGTEPLLRAGHDFDRTGHEISICAQKEHDKISTEYSYLGMFCTDFCM